MNCQMIQGTSQGGGPLAGRGRRGIFGCKGKKNR